MKGVMTKAFKCPNCNSPDHLRFFHKGRSAVVKCFKCKKEFEVKDNKFK